MSLHTSSQQTPTLIIGLSGPSSSGKTTLARLLRGIFNIDASPSTNNTAIKLFILHEDDFYKTDADIPTRTVSSEAHGTRLLQDWDCVESLDLTLLDRTVRHVHRHGRVPPDFASKEDQNSVGDVGVSPSEVSRFRDRVIAWLGGLPATATAVATATTTATTGSSQNESQSESERKVTICILDGFLLFPPPPPTTSTSTSSSPTPTTAHQLMTELHATLAATLTLKIFLPSTKARTIARRAARTGYVTLEGFWADPPGYVDDVVWPNYVRDHAWMFDSPEDVDGGRVRRDADAVVGEGIVIGPGSGEVGMADLLGWAVEVVRGKIAEVLKGGL